MLAAYAPLDDQTLAALQDIFGPDNCVTDQETLAPLCRDEGGLEAPGCAEAAVWGANAEQISRLMRLANEKGFAVTPRGAGSGLAGGVCPVHGGVLLCLERMNRILAIDTENLVAEVEPGVITKDLRDAAAAQGLFYPPDPASLDTSSIGGNAATNAGGPACVKYGATRDYVLGLEAVLPSGECITAGVRTRKGVVGYDLAHLLVGSEGTLGVITKLVLKLVPLPPETRALAAVFADLETAMQCVTQILVRKARAPGERDAVHPRLCFRGVAVLASGGTATSHPDQHSPGAQPSTTHRPGGRGRASGSPLPRER